jgi:hypothetical protein
MKQLIGQLDEAVSTSETWGNFYGTTQRSNPKDTLLRDCQISYGRNVILCEQNSCIFSEDTLFSYRVY